jgi:uncharacterized protein with HEPN domain
LRDRPVHGYDLINLDIIWNIVSNDLPPLLVAIDEVVPSKTRVR